MCLNLTPVIPIRLAGFPAGERMGVSRGTVQRILSSARKKVSTALAECKALVFEKTICKKEK